MERLTIGEVARMVGRHPETLRRYERRGWIPVAKRDPYSRWRVWDTEDVKAIVKLLVPFSDANRKP